MAGCCPETIKFPHETSLDQQLMPLQGITNPIRVDIKYPYLILQKYETTRQFVSYLQFK